MKTFYCLAGALLASTALSGCAASTGDLIKSLASDPSAVSVHQQVTAPGWSVTTDVTRVNSTNTAASANSAGAAVNVPNGSSVNSAPAGSATKPASPSLAGTTTLN